MKTIKTIFLTAMGFSLLMLTGCSVTQSLPYDDVYSSTAPVSPYVAPAQHTIPQSTQNNTYKEGSVQVVNLGTMDTLQRATDTLRSPKEVVLIKNDTTPATNNIYNYYSGLNFDSPYFGTGTSGWALNSYWGSGYNGYWNYYNPYYWNYPFYSWNYPYYYGWNSWYWGSPYSWYNSYYGWNYPYYYGYYPGYYYNTYYTNRRYGHRNTQMLGGNLPYRSVSGGAIPLTATKSANTRTRLSAPANNVINSKAASTQRMVKGSESYRKALQRTDFGRNKNQAVYQKPSGRTTGTPVNPNFKSSNGTRGSNIGAPRYRVNTQEREMNARPRYQKPKQYQSLDNRNPRSSKEYFRPQPGNLMRTNTKSGEVRYSSPTRRFNVYRPNNMQRVNQRPVYRTTNNNSMRYQPSRSFSPTNNGSRIRTYSPQNSTQRTRINTFRPTSAPRFSPSTTSTGTSGGGGGSRTSGGGGGSPHRR
ncbi:MAG: hypothetical protein JXR71_06410 [Bacteroidales bacterium]|nr:hypothetical protein [Bacteroidales bacterium]